MGVELSAKIPLGKNAMFAPRYVPLYPQAVNHILPLLKIEHLILKPFFIAHPYRDPLADQKWHTSDHM